MITKILMIVLVIYDSPILPPIKPELKGLVLAATSLSLAMCTG
jgi:hypothetical protein